MYIIVLIVLALFVGLGYYLKDKSEEKSVSTDNLDSVSAQQVFDFVARHLLTQGKKALSETGYCVYRGTNNLKCAAGCLITDQKYDPKMEGKSWKSVVDNFGVSDNHKNLIYRLQVIHDTREVSEWPIQLNEVAFDYNLQYNSDLYK